MTNSLYDVVTKAISSFVGRIVLAAYTLIVVPFLPSIINFTNGVLGYSLTDAQVQSYADKGALAIGGLVAIWLLNNGLFERAAVQTKTVLESGIK